MDSPAISRSTRQECFERDWRRQLAGADQAAGELENALMDRLEEVLGLEEIRDAIKRLVIDEDRAEQCLLGLDIVRRHAERGFRRSLLACGRIEYCHGPDQGICLWPIWGHSTSRITQRQRHAGINNRCTSHERIVDNGAAPRWEMLSCGFPRYPPQRSRNTRRETRMALDVTLFGARRSARYSPARRSGCE